MPLAFLVQANLFKSERYGANFSKEFFELLYIGFILGAAYMLWLYKRVIFGKLEKKEFIELKDLNLS